MRQLLASPYRTQRHAAYRFLNINEGSRLGRAVSYIFPVYRLLFILIKSAPGLMNGTHKSSIPRPVMAALGIDATTLAHAVKVAAAAAKAAGEVIPPFLALQSGSCL